FLLLSCVTCFVFYASSALRDLHSFPTRRSSDLIRKREFDALRRVLLECREEGGRPGICGYGADRYGGGERVPRAVGVDKRDGTRSEEHTSELQSHLNLVCRLLLEKKKKT